MAEKDPPVGPLRRLDPTEPDEVLDLRDLEPLDPEADDKAPETPEEKPTGSRSRSGLALAVSLAVLLALSSIAAMAGLVAISMGSIDSSAEPAVAPMEAAASGPTIRVVEPKQENERRDRADGQRDARDRATPESLDASPVAAVAPAPAPAPVAETESKREGDSQGRKERKSFGIEGAWCDARPGTSCDVVVGGPYSTGAAPPLP